MKRSQIKLAAAASTAASTSTTASRGALPGGAGSAAAGWPYIRGTTTPFPCTRARKTSVAAEAIFLA